MPHCTKRWRVLYKTRAAVERSFGWLKEHGGLEPLYIRRIERVRLHADLCILTRLAPKLIQLRAGPAQA